MTGKKLVTLIFKKGDKSEQANYRPISLTSICCKTMEHIIHSQVMQHLDIQKILCDQQHGFRKRRSCDSQLLVTIQDISANLDEGEQIDAVMQDFSKAFDKVPHQRLLLKLRHYGIGDSTLQWVQSFLSARSQQVLVEGQASESSPITLGFPQERFLLYIDDMPMKVSSTAGLFADDSLLYRMIRSSQDSISLQEDLDRLQQWEKEWQMSFNPTECVVLRITRKRNPINATYKIHNHDLEVVKQGKYLGVTLAENLSWNKHVDETTKKTNNTLAFLRRNISRCRSEIKAQCYTSRPTCD